MAGTPLSLNPSSVTNSTSSATSTHTPYYQPPPDPTHLDVATYIVAPVLGLSFSLLAGAWYLIRRRRMLQKMKKQVREERAMSFAEKEATRQRRRDLERVLGNKDDKVMRNVTEGTGVGLMAAGM